MKKYVLRMLAVAMLVLGGLVKMAAAQPEPVAGGYSNAKTSDRSVRRAASVAVSTHAKRAHHAVTLVKILKAEKQVVAGMNYRMCLSVRRGRRGHVHTASVVVYEPIRKPMRLTSWEDGGCEDH